jgi:hypothetical protein
MIEGESFIDRSVELMKLQSHAIALTPRRGAYVRSISEAKKIAIDFCFNNSNKVRKCEASETCSDCGTRRPFDMAKNHKLYQLGTPMPFTRPTPVDALRSNARTDAT